MLGILLCKDKKFRLLMITFWLSVALITIGVLIMRVML